MSKNLSKLSGRKGIQDNLFDRMGQLVQEDGAIPKDELARLADEFLVGKANVYGATTFYDFLKPENQGKKVHLCNGSACSNSGKQSDLKQQLSKHFSEDEIGHMTCLGRCHENGAYQYQGKNYSNQSPDDIRKVIRGEEILHSDFYRVDAIGTRILTDHFPGLDEWFGDWEMVLQKPEEELLGELKTAHLRGRGGAGFPIGLKLQSAKEMPSKRKFIICNADEGDPGAYSDRYLLENKPYKVLYGMMMAARIMGANWGILYIRAEYPDAVETIEEAIRQLAQKGWIGKNILDSGFDFEFKIIKAQGAYICGEETALINSIEGQRPEVRVRPPYPTREGLFGEPTVVNNVETLASIPFIIKNSGKEFARIGTGQSTGTKLISVDGIFNTPGVFEVPMGTPLLDVIEKLGGGLSEPVKALHIGGPLGGIVPADKWNQLSVDFESFKDAGFLLGHASMVSIPERKQMIEYLEELMDFAAYESCGKCFPCRLGTTRAHELLQAAYRQNTKIDRPLFDDLLFTLETGSLCAHGGGIPLPVKNALLYFSEELAPYFQTS